MKIGGYELVKKTSSRLFFHFKKELGIPGEVMEIISQIGFGHSVQPIKDKPGYYELIVPKAREEDRFE